MGDAKVSRASAGASAGGGAGGGGAKRRRSLFALLCDDELLNVMRHTSRTPNCEQWKSRLEANELFLVGGPFAAVAPDVFRELCFGDAHFAAGDARPTALLRRHGAYVRALNLGALPQAADEVDALLHTLANHAPQINDLSLRGVAPRVWESFMHALMNAVGTQLHALTLHPPTSIADRDMASAAYWITAKCIHLRRIDFSAPNAPALEAMSSVWYAAGNTLEHITINTTRVRAPLEWSSTLQEIREHCRRIVHFLVDCNSASKPSDHDLSELLASYWTQLRFAGLGEMGTKSCEFVARACPSATFSLNVSDTNVDGILPLGRRLTDVKMELIDPPMPKLLTDAINSAPELTSLQITASCHLDICLDAPFNRKKQLLRSLALHLRGLIVTHDSLAKVALATGKLRHLAVELGAVRDANAFVSIAAANVGLETVEIRTCRIPKVDTIVQMLRSFLVCNALQSISIQFAAWQQLDGVALSELTRRCAFLRHRRIYVQVGRMIIKS